MLKGLEDFNVKEKRILVRCDFNVPLDNKGDILDDFRIKETLPTIKYLIGNKAKIILMSHLDNPDSSVTSSLNVVKDRLEELLNISLIKMDDCIGAEAQEKANNLKSGQVLLLENLRFHKEEFDNDQLFAKNLAKLGDIYINDAFAVCHRAHASVVGVPKYLPKGAGFLLIKEIESLKNILINPKRPMIALIGGKNVQTKSKFIETFLKIADLVIINGFIKKELAEKQYSNILKNVMILSPQDNLDSLDISDKTIEIFRDKILSAKTVLWNGPFGKFEDENYKKGTLAIAKAIIESKAFSVVGGGETIEFLNKEGIVSKFNHVSTGGGAMLQFLSGEKLPGLIALES